MAIIHFPHPKVKNLKKIHRLVVLPDYQGIGLGKIIMNFVGKLLKKQNLKLGITTSQPSLNYSLKLDKNWKLVRIGRLLGNNGLKSLNKSKSSNRITTSWIYDN
jgi:GNAT superfamily N-acetyltransferase